MKCTFLFAMLMTLSTVGFSQDYMEDIAIKSCECLNTVSDTLDIDRFNLDLGLCMINASTPYKKQLKKDYGIDFAQIDTQGEELGQIIGLKMASVCPDALMKIVNKTNENDVEEVSESIFEGQIIGIEDSKFVEFSVKDENGKINKFYWFTFAASNIELSSSYKTLLDKSVRITYISQEFFDARISEYRAFNIIITIDLEEK